MKVEVVKSYAYYVGAAQVIIEGLLGKRGNPEKWHEQAKDWLREVEQL